MPIAARRVQPKAVEVGKHRAAAAVGEPIAVGGGEPTANEEAHGAASGGELAAGG